MKNATELRNALSDLFTGLRAGTEDRATAETLTNIAGKMISSALAQCKYYDLKSEAPNISFLDEPLPPKG